MSNARNLAQAAAVPTALRNKLINGSFDIWQRGTSFGGDFSRGTYYGPDRWQVYRAGGAAGSTFSRIAYNGPESAFALRGQRNQGDTGTATLNVSTSLETIDVYTLRSKQVTLSFRALTGANFSAANLVAGIYWGTGTDSSMAAGFTNTSVLASLNIAPTNGVQGTYSLTTTIPANASQLGVLIGYAPVGTAGANDYFEVTNIQLELGAVANYFERRHPTLELMLCQRYYETDWVNIRQYCGSQANTAFIHLRSFAVPKRAAPTVALSSLYASNASNLRVDSLYAASFRFLADAGTANPMIEASASFSASAEL